MGKRSNFKRIEKDLYCTWDQRAVSPLIDFQKRLGFYDVQRITYYEPCVGKGDLVELLPFTCVGSSDDELDARTTTYDSGADFFITNPPWSRKLLHPIIENLRVQKPTWLLFDADWMHTKQAAPYMKYCNVVISIGRVRWIKGSPYDGKDNCCWYLFKNWESPYSKTRFIPRSEG